MSLEPAPQLPIRELPPVENAATQEQQPLLRLTIAHLMLWTLGIALALGLYRPFLAAQAPSAARPGDEFAVRYFYFQRIITLVVIPFGGAGIAALILAVTHRLGGGQQFPTQPGHWLLLMYGAYYLILSTARLLLSSLGTPGVMYWGMATASLILVPIQVLPLLFVRDSLRWTVLFVVELVRRLGTVGTNALLAIAFARISAGAPRFEVLSLAGGLSAILFLASSVVIVVTLVQEVVARPRRDYLHWAGCLTQIALIVIYLAQWVFPWFAR